MSSQSNYTWPEGRVDFMTAVACKKMGLDNSWEIYAWEVIDTDSEDRDFLVKGGIPRLLKIGPRKGKKTFRDATSLRRAMVSSAEIEKCRLDYETETGKCHGCCGTGLMFRKWSSAGGTEYDECSRCDASGRSPTALRGEVQS